jgi:hypothetical protein
MFPVCPGQRGKELRGQHSENTGTRGHEFKVSIRRGGVKGGMRDIGVTLFSFLPLFFCPIEVNWRRNPYI